MNWDDYDVFCHVIEQAGFSAAARALERPKSTVSAAVARLEARLGVRLLERTTRQVRLTDAGEALYRGVGPLFGRLREAAPTRWRKAKRWRARCASARRTNSAPTISARSPAAHDALSAPEGPHRGRARGGRPIERHYDIAFAMLESALPASGIVHAACSRWNAASLRRRRCSSEAREPKQPQALAELPLLCGAADTRWAFTAADGASESVATTAPRLRSGNADVRLLGLRRLAVEDLDRLLAQLGVEQREVLVGELAGGVVELGVADLAVLGFLQRVGLGRGRRAPRRRPRPARARSARPARAIRPPIHIQVTSGSTMTLKVAGAPSST